MKASYIRNNVVISNSELCFWGSSQINGRRALVICTAAHAKKTFDSGHIHFQHSHIFL